MRDDHRIERRQTAVFDAHAFGQIGSHFRVDVVLHFLHTGGLRLPEFHIGGHGDGVLAVVVYQTCGMPVGTDVGDLPERDIGAGQHRRNQLVLNGFVVVGVVVLFRIQFDGQAAVAFPNGGQRLSVEASGEVEGKHGLGDAKAGTFLGFHSHFHRRQKLIVIGVNPAEFLVQSEHIILDLLRHGSGFRVVIAIDKNLHGCRNSLIVKLAEAHVGLGEVVGIFVVHLLQQVFGGLLRGGVHDELREIVGWDARRVSHVETRRGFADESGD